MKRWTAEDLADVYARLVATGVDFVIIGGQAVNLWSQHYSEKDGQPSETWRALQPFASHDLDLLGGRIEAAAVATALQVEAVLFEPKPRWVVPNSGTLYLPMGTEELIVQFLHTPFGARREEIRSTALVLEWRSIRLSVMHPLICLESKLECLYGLEQRWRQDLRHVRLSILCVAQFIGDLVATGDERSVLGALERMADLATSELGLRLWHEHALLLETALNTPALMEPSARLPKIAAFLEKRWPRLEAELETRRARYRSLPGLKT